MNSSGEKPTQPVQMYTLATATRLKQKPAGNVIQSSHEISMQVREAVKRQPENAVKRPPQLISRLPLSMIVSKMATRRPIKQDNKENNNLLDNIDLSRIREYRLSPPSWRNKPGFRQRQMFRSRPTEFEKISEEMKRKCSQLPRLCLQRDSRIVNTGQYRSELQKLIAETRGKVPSTPAQEYNYRQLYDRPSTHNQDNVLHCDEEDPFPDPHSEAHSRPETPGHNERAGPCLQQDARIVNTGRSVESLMADTRGNFLVPKYNYHQLYDRPNTCDQDNVLQCDEDPFTFDPHLEAHSRPKTHLPGLNKRSDKCKSRSVVSSSEPEFVWNPVIIRTKQTSSIFTNIFTFDGDVPDCHEQSYEDLNYCNESCVRQEQCSLQHSELDTGNSAFCVNRRKQVYSPHEYLDYHRDAHHHTSGSTLPQYLDDHHDVHPHTSRTTLPTPSYSPCPSSTSSGITVAEERLRLTYFSCGPSNSQYSPELHSNNLPGAFPVKFWEE